MYVDAFIDQPPDKPEEKGYGGDMKVEIEEAVKDYPRESRDAPCD